MKRLWILAALAAIAACTPAQHQAWLQWHAQDPAAAEAYAEEWKANHAAQATSSTSSGWTLNWDAVARCESGGDWSHGPVTNQYGTFSGGLMWNHKYWLANGGGEYAQFPYQATKEQQIAVSEGMIDGSYAAADRAWQCVGGPARSGV